MKWMGNFKDLTGMKFNMLIVLEQPGKETGMILSFLLGIIVGVAAGIAVMALAAMEKDKK